MLDKKSPHMHWAWIEEHNRILWKDMDIIYKLLEKCPGNQFVDLGCFIGGFTAAMGKVAKKRGGRVYSIDLYKETKQGLDFCNEHMGHPCKEYFMENMVTEGVMDVIELNQGCSWEFASKFEDNSVDFIWLDADHHYESVIKELRAWYPKLKIGGYIGGHDYADVGVEKAVMEFFEEFTVHVSNNVSWSYRKVE